MCRAISQDTVSSSLSSSLDYKFVAVIVALAAVVLIALIILFVILMRTKSRLGHQDETEQPNETSDSDPPFLESTFNNSYDSQMPGRKEEDVFENESAAASTGSLNSLKYLLSQSNTDDSSMRNIKPRPQMAWIFGL